jgi:hypothetical protein
MAIQFNRHFRSNHSELDAAKCASAGAYDVLVANASGVVTSRVAVLEVDATFTKITCGDIVTDRAEFFNCSWIDFDND